MKRGFIVGIDEAGRGPLAGPVTVALVAAKNFKLFKNIRDSKKLSWRQREEWFRKIKSNPRILAVHASVGNKLIDKLGIVRALARAVRNCLKKLEVKYLLPAQSHKILLDGSLYAPKNFSNQQTIIKGDEKVPIIAAASIIAKVTRDRKMIRLARIYPRYSFEIHKGYGTRLHQEAIRKHGICDSHRKSFCAKFL